ncbi:MAG TPA: acyl-[ACP]--phospholipid O-acyltransferase [Candidatus Binatia bacterium]|nr:acyl-[ACP]--phospholipid O-acyltransferase [Candidatus Binatia bacterium]
MAAGKYIDILKDRGFFCFFWTQFLGAFNDNFYKIIVTLVALDIPAAAGGGAQYIPLIGGLFILPFLLFSGYAGYLADVHSKRNILVAVKVFEIFAMALGLLAFFVDRMEPMLAVVFLMGLQSSFFSPAKYGILPEMLSEKDLSRGNGLLEMSTFMAIILGTSFGGVIYEAWKNHLGWIGAVLIAIAAVGTLTSLGITRVPPSGSSKNFVINPLSEIRDGTKRLYWDRPLWFTVMGISYFWFLGAFIQMALPLFGKEILDLSETRIGLLWTFAAAGIGLGGLGAGRLSGDKIELGLVPLGAIGMGIFSVALFFSPPSFAWSGVSLVLMGFAAGFFAVPLNALLQHRSGREDKGRLIATNNVFNTFGVLLASALLWALSTAFHLPADQVILILGCMTFVLTLYALYLLPDFFVRFVLWIFTHTLYRIRIVGQEHIPLRGPALLVSNHVSFVDAFMIGASLPRFVRFMLHREYYDLRWLNWLFRLMKSIPISANHRRDIVHALQSARKELEEGQVVCIFAEGGISRIGHLLPFKRGFEKIVQGTDCPIIPVHLDQLWGSIFSFKEGRFFWKWPKLLPYPVTVSFGAPLPSTATVHEVRQAVLELESQAFKYRRATQGLLHTRFIRTAKRRWFSFCMADTTGAELPFGKALIGGMLISRWLRKHATNDSMIGIVLPASVGGALANIAVALAGKVPVNLNFTAGQEGMNAAIRQCGIKTIVTSRLFLSKANVGEVPGMVFLEEIRESFTSTRKLWTLISALLVPSRVLERYYGKNQKAQDLATVIFSSGSTGTPKGVMLSYHNILANIESVCQVIHFEPSDKVMGVLPFFHSFGFSISLWLPLIVGFGAVYHPNPMDAKTIGETVQKYRATILISTPTFYAGYMRRCTAEEFASLRYVIAGAEKLREQIRNGFKEKYGLDLLEGYGCTELAPVVSVNLPDVVGDPERQIGHKPGTVGHPIPGVAVKVVDPDTGQALPPGQTGMLIANGANRMIGYLGQPELTEEALRDGWYVTGDIGSVDEDGFITITDRSSRFSKVAGEMVPHMAIEEVINTILGEAASVVTAVPDEHRGEKLIAFYSRNGIDPDELWEKLNHSDLPKYWIPKRENIHSIDSIPLLGSGKIDLKSVKRLAAEKAGHRK